MTSRISTLPFLSHLVVFVSLWLQCYDRDSFQFSSDDSATANMHSIPCDGDKIGSIGNQLFSKFLGKVNYSINSAIITKILCVGQESGRERGID